MNLHILKNLNEAALDIKSRQCFADLIETGEYFWHRLLRLQPFSVFLGDVYVEVCDLGNGKKRFLLRDNSFALYFDYVTSVLIQLKWCKEPFELKFILLVSENIAIIDVNRTFY